MGEISLKERFSGCLLGGAIGDAFGYPVEFMFIDRIMQSYGKNGITELKPDKEKGVALISDDTQMTLFTAEGIIAADRLGGKTEITSYTTYVFYSYQRWLYTQMNLLASREYAHVLEDDVFMPELISAEGMLSRRAPDNTCLSALQQASEHGYGRIVNKINNSKGCGGVMRVAPAGLYFHRDTEKAFRMSAEFAAITHTHFSGYLAAGVLGAIISELVNGSDINRAVEVALYILKSYDGCMETYRAVEHARALEASDIPPMEAVRRLGEGWVAEETLAIALYCVLCHEGNVENALRLSVNHSGDSDSTGAVCGNIIGAMLGEAALPKRWLKKLELADVIRSVSDRLYACASAGE